MCFSYYSAENNYKFTFNKIKKKKEEIKKVRFLPYTKHNIYYLNVTIFFLFLFLTNY